MGLPDPQRAYYEALLKAAEEQLPKEMVDYAYETEPESHVFYGDAYENGYDDPDDYREIIMEIGSRDLNEKIRHWESAILSGGDFAEFRPRGFDPIQRAEMRMGA